MVKVESSVSNPTYRVVVETDDARLAARIRCLASVEFPAIHPGQSCAKCGQVEFSCCSSVGPRHEQVYDCIMCCPKHTAKWRGEE